VFWDFRPDERAGRQPRHDVPGPAGDHGVRRPGAGEYGAFQPGAANSMGYDDLKVIEAYRFLRSIAEGTPHGATLQDAVHSAAVLDAMVRSAESGTWASQAA